MVLSKKRITRRWSDSADAQARLRLCYLQTPEDRFSRVEAHLKVHTLHNTLVLDNIGLNATNPVFKASNKERLKPVSSAIETS